MKVLARDDCFTYYLAQAIRRRKTPFTLLCYDEKIPSPILIDALDGLRSDPAVVLPALSEPYFYRTQKTLSCLAIVGADMILMGSFSDLAVRVYRHRQEGWKFSERWNHIADKEYLNRHFERMDLISIPDAVDNSSRLFRVFEGRNPGAKKLWINYPYVDGAPTGWNGVTVPNRVMKDRWSEFTKMTTERFPGEGIMVLNVPEEHAVGRGDGQLWHYPDSTYDWAAGVVIDWIKPTSVLPPSTAG